MTETVFSHQDTLSALNDNLPLAAKLRAIHDVLRQAHPFVSRLAIALYDADTDVVKTFAHSSGGADPLSLYESRLQDAPSLQEVVAQRKPRVIQDLALFNAGQSEHTQRIAAQGYRASYTTVLYQNGHLLGFLFLNSFEKNCFGAENLTRLDLFAHLISAVIANELVSIRTLLATVQAARHVTAYRDRETGAHVSRTSYYARLIAQALAPKYGLKDEFVEQVFLFSPLHDIGKIAVPEAILGKHGKLNEQEYAVMKDHTKTGRELIDVMLKDFALNTLGRAEILRNIAYYHHEAVDGSGYPEGLAGDAIPLEARISSVADVFDALTSRRPYKEAWSNDEAFAMLQRLAGSKLDGECVAGLIKNRSKVEEIQARFLDAPPAP